VIASLQLSDYLMTRHKRCCVNIEFVITKKKNQPVDTEGVEGAVDRYWGDDSFRAQAVIPVVISRHHNLRHQFADHRTQSKTLLFDE